MGASESQPAPMLAATAESATVADVCATPSPASLEALPCELLASVCSRLDVRSLSSVASVCHELRSAVPDAAWAPHVARLVRAGAAAAEDVSHAERRITNSVERAAAIQAATESAEAAAFSTALEAVLGATPCCRLRVGLLRSLVCDLCESKPCGALWLPTISRGVCRACVRTQPSAADAWRYHQSAFELAAMLRRDAAIASQISDVLGPSLPLALREVRPRLVFSSDTHGGSLATMLRRARGCQASVLVLTLRDADDDGSGGGGGGGEGAADGAPPPTTPPAAPPPLKTILSPLALRDIGRQARRASLALRGGAAARMVGAFCPVPWPRTPNERPKVPFGDATARLFALAPARRVYAPAADDELPARGAPSQAPASSSSSSARGHFRCDGERGLSIGGDDVLPAVSVSTDLATGRVLPCRAFGTLAGLAPSTEPFAIARAALWDLTPPEDDDEGSAAGKAAIDEASVLTARRADAMMLPFRTSMMMRVE